MSIVSNIMDGKFVDLKDDIEQRIATKFADKINTKKAEVIQQINENKTK